VESHSFAKCANEWGTRLRKQRRPMSADEIEREAD
jgi:hypothetical protein